MGKFMREPSEKRKLRSLVILIIGAVFILSGFGIYFMLRYRSVINIIGGQEQFWALITIVCTCVVIAGIPFVIVGIARLLKDYQEYGY